MAMANLLECVSGFLGSFLHSVTDVFRTLRDDVPRLLAGVLSGPAGFVCSLSSIMSGVFHPLAHAFDAILRSMACFLGCFLGDTASVFCCFVDIGRDVLCKPNCTQREN